MPSSNSGGNDARGLGLVGYSESKDLLNLFLAYSLGQCFLVSPLRPRQNSGRSWSRKTTACSLERHVQCVPKRRSEDRYRDHITMKTFTLIALVSTENPQAIKLVLEELVSKRSITRTDEGFLVKATMHGESARELNRTLLSAPRRVERKTRLRSEWKSGGTTEPFFDYVPKGSRKA